MKKIIGIAGNERTTQENEQTFYFSYTPREFVEGITEAGGLPVILPLGNPEDAATYIQGIDKLLLPGGQDVDPSCYHQASHELLGETNQKRDAFELALIEEAIKQGKPIVGVCRGMQLLNVAFGGTLYQDASLNPAITLKHVQLPVALSKPTHQIVVKSGSMVRQFLPETYCVNSYHHQFVDQLAPTFTVTATAEDSGVEAIESTAHGVNILGIQWHPEQTFHSVPSDLKFFEYVVHAL